MARVLIVDDVTENITLLKDNLKSIYEVIGAKSGTKALSLLQKSENLPDLILLDVLMPDMNGFEVCKVIKSNPQTVHIPIIFLTVLDQTHDILEGFELGGVDYITKPFEPSILHARIGTHLTLAKQRRELEEYTHNLETIIEQKRKEIQKQYITDYLTTLPNKLFLDQYIATEKSYTIVLLNIDNFRLINQNLSYDVGDKILIEVANRLKKYASQNFILCRLQGDEFIFLATGEFLDEAKKITQSIKFDFDSYAITVEGVELDITFTMAVDYSKKDNLLKLASTTIQALREEGKNRVGIREHNHKFKEQQQNNLFWIKKVKECLRRDQIDVYYQAIKDIHLNKINKYEALARIILEDKSIILPHTFIKPAILAGVGTQITKVVIDKSFKEIQNKQVELSINITQDDLREEYLIDYLQSKTKEYGIAKSQVILEILESISVDEEKRYIEQLNRLKEQGYKIAIDDFGTEMSNFSRLMSINPDYIKIDGSFIKNIDQDSNAHEIVSTIISFAHKVGSKVIAEFVHNQSVCKQVQHLAVDYVQGYYIAKPLPTINEDD